MADQLSELSGPRMSFEDPSPHADVYPRITRIIRIAAHDLPIGWAVRKEDQQLPPWIVKRSDLYVPVARVPTMSAEKPLINYAYDHPLGTSHGSRGRTPPGIDRPCAWGVGIHSC